MCDETYSKHCSITYKQVGQNDTLVHCYNPLVRDCVDQEESGEAGDCREYQVQNVPSYILYHRIYCFQETACTTRYVETSPGKFVADTACEKVPVSYCTRDNCRMVPGPQECHDKVRPSNNWNAISWKTLAVALRV